MVKQKQIKSKVELMFRQLLLGTIIFLYVDDIDLTDYTLTSDSAPTSTTDLVNRLELLTEYELCDLGL
jgi:hypothetical protein